MYKNKLKTDIFKKSKKDKSKHLGKIKESIPRIRNNRSAVLNNFGVVKKNGKKFLSKIKLQCFKLEEWKRYYITTIKTHFISSHIW